MSDHKHGIATVDKRPFFEKALCHGVQQRLIDPLKCQAMIDDGAKGTLQVADYFGTSHLHADLDNARKRIVNLVSLYLEDGCSGNLDKAAQSLRDNSFLSHSRGGNDMLKNLHAMPESTVFGDIKGQALKEFQDERTLTKPLSLAAYRKELQRRHDNMVSMAAARWFAQDMGVPSSALDFIAADTVVRTAIMVRLGGLEECPNRQAFAQLIDKLKTKALASGKLKIPKAMLDDVPQEHRAVAGTIRREIEKYDAPLMLDAKLALDVMLNQFESRYFFRESGLEDVDQFDAFVSKEWSQLTKGKEDPYSRLTLFMCLAAGVKPKTTLTDAEARALIRQVREHGFDEDAVPALIKASAPFEIKQDLLGMWEEEFFPDAQLRLLDDFDTRYVRALQFLKDNCNIKDKPAAKKKG